MLRAPAGVAAISAATDPAVFVEPQDNFDSALVSLSIGRQNWGHWGPLFGVPKPKGAVVRVELYKLLPRDHHFDSYPHRIL